MKEQLTDGKGQLLRFDMDIQNDVFIEQTRQHVQVPAYDKYGSRNREEHGAPLGEGSGGYAKFGQPPLKSGQCH